MKIKCNAFVLRQTKDSPFSYFAGTWEELETLAQINIATGRKGYRPGVLIIRVPAESFYSGVTVLTRGTKLSARFEARKEGEQQFVQVFASGTKTEAVAVEIILYSRALLVEEIDQEIARLDMSDPEAQLTHMKLCGGYPDLDTAYEIVSINARTSIKAEPMTPMAMARNFLKLEGGTEAVYSAEEFAESICYWSTRAMHDGGQ